MTEKWLPIKDYEGIYEVSNTGKIRTVAGKTTYTKRHGVRHWKQRVLKPKGQTYATGYRVTLWKQGEYKDYLVSRLVAFTFYDENIANRNLTVNHIDGNRFNNDLANLELIPLADNIKHAFDTGLMPTQTNTKIYSLSTNYSKWFRSMSQTDLFLGRAIGYLSNCFKKRKIATDCQGHKYWVITCSNQKSQT